MADEDHRLWNTHVASDENRTQTRRSTAFVRTEVRRSSPQTVDSVGRPRGSRPLFVPAGPGSTAPARVVRTQNLTLGIGEKTVLADVEMDIDRGTITAIIGPTGTGKSVFLRTLNRMNDNVPGFATMVTSPSTARASGPSTEICWCCAAKSG
jgi:ABC-type multidrug transport system fused ATPase/permease subunit